MWLVRSLTISLAIVLAIIGPTNGFTIRHRNATDLAAEESTIFEVKNESTGEVNTPREDEPVTIIPIHKNTEAVTLNDNAGITEADREATERTSVDKLPTEGTESITTDQVVKTVGGISHKDWFETTLPIETDRVENDTETSVVANQTSTGPQIILNSKDIDNIIAAAEHQSILSSAPFKLNEPGATLVTTTNEENMKTEKETSNTEPVSTMSDPIQTQTTDTTTTEKIQQTDTRETTPFWKKYTNIERIRVTNTDTNEKVETTPAERVVDSINAHTTETRVSLEQAFDLAPDILSLQQLKTSLMKTTNAIGYSSGLETTNSIESQTESITQTTVGRNTEDQIPARVAEEGNQIEMVSKRAGYLDHSKTTILSDPSPIVNVTRDGTIDLDIIGYELDPDGFGTGNKTSQSQLAEDAMKEELLKESFINDKEETSMLSHTSDEAKDQFTVVTTLRSITEPIEMEHATDKKVTNNLPEPRVTDNLPEQKVTNNLPEPRVTDNLPEQKVTNNLPEPRVIDNPPEQKVTNNLPEPRVIDNPPEQKVTNNLPEPRVIDNPPEQKVTNNLPEPRVRDNIPEQKVTNNLSEPRVTDKLPEQKATNNIPKPRVTDNRSEQKVTDKLFDQKVTDNLLEQTITDNLFEQKVTDKPFERQVSYNATKDTISYKNIPTENPAEENASEDLSVKPISPEKKVTANLYTVNPNYKPLKKLEIQPPKSFTRDPDDNSWRNESLSSLGIVFKAKNSSKAFTEVLKNKTEIVMNNLPDQNRTIEKVELRDRLEKIAEKRKSKKKKTDQFGNTEYTDYEENNNSGDLHTSKETPADIDPLVTPLLLSSTTPTPNLSPSTSQSPAPKTPSSTVTSTMSLITNRYTLTSTDIPKKTFNMQEYYDISEEEDYANLPKVDILKATTRPRVQWPVTQSMIENTHPTQLFSQRKPTVQYFPPRPKPTKGADVIEYTPPTQSTVTLPQRFTESKSYPSRNQFQNEHVNYASNENRNQPPVVQHVQYRPVDNKNAYHTPQPKLPSEGQHEIPESYNHGYVIRHYKDLIEAAIKDNDYDRNLYLYTEQPMPRETAIAAKTPVKPEEYDYDARKEVLDRFVDNFNQNHEQFKADFPVVFNTSIVHQHGPEGGKVLASSSAMFKRLYNDATATKANGFLFTNKPYDPNCENITVELSPAYELHYYVPDQEEREEQAAKVTIPYGYRI